jgi:hypothetical protein
VRRGANPESSLLGRQGVAESPLARYRLAVGADQTSIYVFHAALTKDFACPWHKISRSSQGRRLRAQSTLEQLYQNFCTKTREAGGLLSHHNPHCLTLILFRENERRSSRAISTEKHSRGKGSGVTAKEDFPCGNARPSCLKHGLL